MSNDTNATSVDAVTLDVAKIATSTNDVHDTKDLITPVEKKESESVKRIKEGLVSIIKVIIPP
ncbi:hypothetical protein [Aquirhabdus parva]|uniref:Uncharacterized protein n=1 Tax=Aquirhabdus parva TaxID=2283318 RepID=A0A345P3P2_9GAMM|nr:hypothetical protein [Aquirhabdus parva]AXI01901.1 hypothetical protein HYN46_02805 [Aquirhabdus parva]